MTLTQTVKVPENRRLHLDLEVPREIPTGSTARFDVIWFPQKEKTDLDATLEKIWELCKDAPVSVDGFLEERRKDLELEEKKLFGDSK